MNGACPLFMSLGDYGLPFCFFLALLVAISSDGGCSPPNPSVFSGIRLFILIYQKLQFYVELAVLQSGSSCQLPEGNPIERVCISGLSFSNLTNASVKSELGTILCSIYAR